MRGISIVVGSLLVAAALGAGAAPNEEDAPRSGPGASRSTASCEASPGGSNTGNFVVIPPDWKSTYPFSARFSHAESVSVASESADLVIDLDAIQFRTASLGTIDPTTGDRDFLDPDLSSFDPEVVRKPFAGTKTDLFIVQAGTPAGQVALRAYLESSAIRILDYIPQQAYLVSIDKTVLGALKRRPEVTWVGLFQPAYRFAAKLEYVLRNDPAHELKFTILCDESAYPSAASLESEVKLVGLTPLAVELGTRGWIARAQGRALDARQLAKLPGTLWVERYVDPQILNDVARTSSSVATGRGTAAGPIMDVENVWAQGIHGEGQIAAAADTGLSTGDITTSDSLHRDFGQVGSATNPMRVIKGYALGRTTTWDDNQATGGGHGTHTSGSIVGNGIRSGSTPSTNTYGTSHAGTAPKARYVFQSVMDRFGNLGGLPSDLNNLFQPPYADGARVHSNSWGAAVAGAYNANAQQLDQFTWNNKDMVITFSAGNSGVDTTPANGVIDTNSMGSPGTAKNCITVGAAEGYRPTVQYEYPSGTCNTPTWNWFNAPNYGTAPISADLMANNASGMAAFSSRGPCSDSRNKPDIVAPGTFILSTRTNMNQAFEQWGTCGVAAGERAYYLWMGGTSMANPLTAGTAVLVRQYYSDGWHANNSILTNASPVPAQGFNPSSALVKATLINGAWDMTPGQYPTGTTTEIPAGWDTGHNLPNNVEGYGRVDLMHSLFPGSGWGDVAGRLLEVHDVSPGLVTGGADNYTFNVSGSGNPLIVTLVWTDPYGATAAGTELVNNVDLVVTAPNGTTKYTPNKVDDTVGTADNKNNVEQVKVTAPVTGTWTIQVKGTAVPGNGQSGTTTQPYALVISGVAACTAPGAPSLTSATGTCTGVDLAWTAGTGTTNAYDVYRSANTVCPVGALTKLNASPIPPATLTYSDTTAVAGTTYTYVVRGACDAAGTTESGNSNCLAAARPAPPAAPVIASVTAPQPNQLTVTWGGVTGATSYNVYRSGGTCPGGAYTLLGNTASTSWVDGTVTGGLAYSYQVSAVASCVSSPSACSSATATGTCALPPTFLGLTSATAGAAYANCAVNLAWNAGSSNCGGTVTYSVYRSTAAGFVPSATNRIALGVTGTSYIDTAALAASTAYYYVVRAVDSTTGIEETNTVQRSTTTAATCNPGVADVLAFTATSTGASVATSGQNVLQWSYPSWAPLGPTITIRYRTDGVYPTSPTDGLPVLSGRAVTYSPDTYTHTGLTDGTTYTYTLFVRR